MKFFFVQETGAPSDTPETLSSGSLFSRWVIKILVAMIALLMVFFNGHDDAWPFVHWPMYAEGDYSPPSRIHRDELRVIDTEGNTHALTSFQLLTLDDDSSTQIPGTDLITNAFEDESGIFGDWYKAYLLARVERLIKMDVVEIQQWRFEWAVDFTRYPFVQLDQPLQATMRDSFTVSYFDDEIDPPAPPDQAADLRFGDSLELLAHELPMGTQIAQCKPLYLRSWWRAATTPPADYQITVVLTDQQGIGQIQSDGALAGKPTSQWQTDDQALDRRQFVIPCDLPVGTYNLLIALYELDTLAHLPVAYADGTPAGEYAYLTSIEIIESKP